MKAFLLVVGAVLLALATPAQAGLEEGEAALKRQDIAGALREFSEAAKLGNMRAQYYLGLMYANGLGVTRDDVEAITWYRRAAEQGDSDARTSLGFMYDEGRGVKQDYVEAVKWYRKAAEQGAPGAQMNLFYMYANGYGVAKDQAAALNWLRQSAARGFPPAQSKLSDIYRTGVYKPDVPHDYAEAVTWARRAAEQGFPEAQFNLAKQYAMGVGVTADPIEAYVWFYQAARNCPPGPGREQCARYIENAARAMSPEDLAKAKARADEVERTIRNLIQSRTR